MALVTIGGKPEPRSRVAQVANRRSTYLTNESGGATSANGDYSSASATYSAGPPSDETWIVERMIIYILDSGSFSASEYGNIGAALTNGYNVKVLDDSGDIKTLNGAVTFKSNGQMGATCYDVNNVGVGSGGDDAILVRWTFTRAGSPLRLIGADGGKVSITFSDDLSGLSDHTFFIDAYLE